MGFETYGVLVNPTVPQNPVASTVLEFPNLSAAALNDDLVPAMDVSVFKVAVLILSGTFVGTVTFQASADGVNWYSTVGVQTASGIPASQPSTGGQGWIIPLYLKYFRVRRTAYTSGVITGSLRLSTVEHNIDWLVTSMNITGSVAHDAVDSGNPVKIGGKGRNADPSPVLNLDRTDLYTDLLGKPVFVPIFPRALMLTNMITLTSTTETTLVSSGGAGIYVDITSIIVTNTSATAVRVDIRDATNGTVRISVMAPATLTVIIPIGTAPIIQAASNNNWTAQISAAVTDVRITAVAGKRSA
jgi:hypothetical protein